ncbi:TerB family tellurite resistance protein [Halomonas sp. YLGW01]|uniref:tellurite resistance TerB family protein n=1 Tax=Halomonas sp. YLGW01 TaxID=2773308 RepID=UPI00177CBF94|nr:TerB family tellurite resistance protein [Halomonas sp. YLGW01]
MLDAIQQFFQRTLVASGQSSREPTLELAAAALLCEVVRADYQHDPRELDALRAMLLSHFPIEEGTVDELMALAQQEVEEAVGHYQFVSLIKEHYGYAQRAQLIRLMWQLAYADDELSPLEEHRIRRLADLLHVGHGDFIRAKLSVQDALSGSR